MKDQPKYSYKAVVTITRVEYLPDEGKYAEDPETLVACGHEHQADSFDEVFPTLEKYIGQQWLKISEIRSIVEEGDSK